MKKATKIFRKKAIKKAHKKAPVFVLKKVKKRIYKKASNRKFEIYFEPKNINMSYFNYVPRINGMSVEEVEKINNQLAKI